MKVRFLTEQDHSLIRGFFQQFTYRSFLQSPEWCSFQNTVHHQARQIGIFSDDRLLLYSVVIRHQLPFGWFYWYCPRGPLLLPSLSDQEKESTFFYFLQQISEFPETAGALFFRYEGCAALPQQIQRYTIPRWIQPPATSRLDLTKSEEELLSSMKQKTRYNIRVAQKHGVTVERSSSEEDFQYFFEGLVEVSRRQGIRSHPFSYYHSLFTSSFARLYVARYGEKVAASGIFIFFEDTVTYLHGGSRFDFHAYMAPYALQWFVIQQAKQEGFHFYDFGGTAPTGSSSDHSLAKLTRFKMGFGGDEHLFSHRYDVIFSPGRFRLFSLAKYTRSLFIKRLRT